MASVYKQPCDEGVIRARPADAPCAQRQRKWVLAATILGSSLAFIDASSTNVALPALQGSLGATVIEVQWVAAHVDYEDDERVIGLITRGIGQPETAPVVKERCTWLEVGEDLR